MKDKNTKRSKTSSKRRKKKPETTYRIAFVDQLSEIRLHRVTFALTAFISLFSEDEKTLECLKILKGERDEEIRKAMEK